MLIVTHGLASAMVLLLLAPVVHFLPFHFGQCGDTIKESWLCTVFCACLKF